MKPISIYIVEDELLISASLKSQLQNFGYEILGSCTRGEVCLEEFESMSNNGNEPEIVLMDIHLRGEMDGIETAKKLGEKFRCAIIFLTGQSSKEVYDRSFRIKPFGYLLKPLDIEQTKMTIEIAAYQRNLEIENRIYQKKLEDLLEKQTQEKSELLAMYRSIIDSTVLGITIMQDERLVFVNKRAADILGFDPNELQSFHVSQFTGFLYPENGPEERIRRYQDESNEDLPQSSRIKIMRKDGNERIIETQLRTIQYNGKSTILQTFLDITEYQHYS